MRRTLPLIAVSIVSLAIPANGARVTVPPAEALVGPISYAQALAARGETPAAFGRRCIPADCVAPPSNIPDILGRRALSAGRLAALGATPDFHHGLLDVPTLRCADYSHARRSRTFESWRC